MALPLDVVLRGGRRSMGKALCSNSAVQRCTTSLQGNEESLSGNFHCRGHSWCTFLCMLAKIVSSNASIRLHWTQPRFVVQCNPFVSSTLACYIFPFISSAFPLAFPSSSAALPLASSAFMPVTDAALSFASTVREIVSNCGWAREDQGSLTCGINTLDEGVGNGAVDFL